MAHLHTQVLNHIRKNKSPWLVIDFDRHRTLRHFDFIKSEIDNWLEEILTEDNILTRKIGIVLITHKDPSQNDKTDFEDVDVFGSDWQYVVIENLLGTAYQSNVKFVEYENQDLARIMGDKINQKSVFKIFSESLRKIKFSSYLAEFVQNKLLPETMRMSKGRGEQRQLAGFIQQVYDSYSATRKVKAVTDWREEVLGFEDFEKEGILNVEQMLMRSQVIDFTKILENLFLKLKKENCLFNLLSCERLGERLREVFRDIFYQRLVEILKKNQYKLFILRIIDHWF